MSDDSLSDDIRRVLVKRGLLLLSLDLVADRLEALQVFFVRPDLVKQAARNVLEFVRQFPAESEKSDPTISQIVESLENVGDPEDAKRAAEWLTRLVSVRRCQYLMDYWGPVLLLFGEEYATVLRQLGMSEESVQLLAKLSDSWGERLNELESLNESLEQSVTSDWDRSQYREYQRESELVSPIDYLSAWLHTERFLEIMRRIADQLEPRELKLFEAWGKATASVQTRIPESALSLENLNEILASCSDE